VLPVTAAFTFDFGDQLVTAYDFSGAVGGSFRIGGDEYGVIVPTTLLATLDKYDVVLPVTAAFGMDFGDQLVME
jgi:hypothetical protein